MSDEPTVPFSPYGDNPEIPVDMPPSGDAEEPTTPQAPIKHPAAQ